MPKRAAYRGWVGVATAGVGGTACPAVLAAGSSALSGTPMATANLPWWAVVTIGLVLLAALAGTFVWMHRAFKFKDRIDSDSIFALADLRRLRDDGLISAQEYETLREVVRRRELERTTRLDEEGPRRLR